MVLPFVGEVIQFFMTPGHTDASISFTIGKHLFTGDTLIKDERTVTKLPTGYKERLRVSMVLYTQQRRKGLTVYPGHGEQFALDEYDLKMMIDAKHDASII